MSRVLRVNFEVENIGERVAASKKRLTWRFIFKGSEQVHTVSLEHSRMSAKKRVKLDGVQVSRQEKFVSGEWKYEFSFEDHSDIPFVLCILDIKKAKTLNDMYHLIVDGKDWTELTDRNLNLTTKAIDTAASKWGSDSYARKVSYSQEKIETNEVRITWVFTFGLDGELHKLVLDHCDDGEKHLILNRREIYRTAQLDEGSWSFPHTLVDGHQMIVAIEPSETGRQYLLNLNGSKWADIAETDYVLQHEWEPVQSRSTGKVYYRNDETKETQWTKPVLPKSEVTESTPSTDKGSAQKYYRIDSAINTTPTSSLLPDMEEEKETAQVDDLLDIMSLESALPPVPTQAEATESAPEGDLLDVSTDPIPPPTDAVAVDPFAPVDSN